MTTLDALTWIAVPVVAAMIAGVGAHFAGRRAYRRGFRYGFMRGRGGRIRRGEARTHPHIYLSTGCLHGEHDYCRAGIRGDGGPKRPARCKFCDARCICVCHAVEDPVDDVDDAESAQLVPQAAP